MKSSSAASRWLARTAAVIAVFAPLLASLGARGNGDARVVLSAALSVMLVIALSRCRDGLSAFAASLTGFLALSLIAYRWGFSLHRDALGWGAYTDLTDVVWIPILQAVSLLPLSLAVHRGAEHDSHDARDGLALAMAASTSAALVETALSIAAVRSWGGSYTGMAAVGLGPALLGLLLLAALGALASLVRSARWMRRWRRLLASADVRIEPRSRWTGAVPERPWMRIPFVANDGVLVRRTAQEAGAYRAGDVEEALTVAPLDAARVRQALWMRAAASLALLGALAAFTATRVAPLRW